MFPYINPQLAAVMAAQGLPTPAPSTDPNLINPPQPDSVNDGINSVARPADSAKADAARKKLDRASKGEALMALGAQLLSSRNFGEGLSKGILAYTQTLRSLRPTSKSVGDGEYEQVTDPRTGETYYRATPIHDDKVAERGKPVVSGKHLYQYGLDEKGRYNGSVKDLAPPSLEAKTIRDAAGNEMVVFVDTNSGAVYDPKGTQLSPPTNASEPAPTDASPAPVGGAEGFSKAIAFTLPHEGGLTTDVNGAPVNFGINAAYNPGVDVKNLTADRATDIYKSKYWDKSGAANLPATLQTPFFDTYVISPKRAQRFLQESGGDPNRFMDLREAWLNDFADKHPKLARGIANRNRDLRATITEASAAAPATDAPMEPYYQGQPDAPAPAAAPDNPFGLQPHDFSNRPPAVRYLTAEEKKVAGYPEDSIVQRDAAGRDSVKEKGTTGEGLSPDAIDQNAVSYLKTGKMTTLGLGNTSARTAILNRAAAMLKEHNMTDDDANYMQAAYASDVQARRTRGQQLSYMRQATATAIRHGEEALKLAFEVPGQTNVKLWNLLAQGVLDQTSNPTLYALQSAAKQAEAEVAKVITGNPNSGAGQLTDDARREFKILEGPAAPAAKKKAWDTIVRMMHEKTQSVQEEVTNLDTRVHGGIEAYRSNPPPKPSARPAPPKAGAVVRGYRFKGGNPADKNNWTKI